MGKGRKKKALCLPALNFLWKSRSEGPLSLLHAASEGCVNTAGEGQKEAQLLWCKGNAAAVLRRGVGECHNIAGEEYFGVFQIWLMYIRVSPLLMIYMQKEQSVGLKWGTTGLLSFRIGSNVTWRILWKTCLPETPGLSTPPSGNV